MPSAIFLNWDQSKILSSGIGLKAYINFPAKYSTTNPEYHWITGALQAIHLWPFKVMIIFLYLNERMPMMSICPVAAWISKDKKSIEI